MQADKKDTFERDLRAIIKLWIEKKEKDGRSQNYGTLAFDIMELCERYKCWDTKLIDETLDSMGRRDQASNK